MPDLYTKPPPGEVIGTAGDDRLYSGKAADRVDGLGGVDTFVTGSIYASLHRELDGAGNSVWMVGDDTLVNIEFVQFSDLLIRLDDPVLLQAVQHAGTTGPDVLVGDDRGYVLSGGEGDDVLTGNGGDDALYGGKGNDSAVYRGHRADYRLSYDTYSQQLFVSDQTPGRDGRDVLISIEALRFADGEISVASLLATIPAPRGEPAAPGSKDWVWTTYGIAMTNDNAPNAWAVESTRTVAYGGGQALNPSSAEVTQVNWTTNVVTAAELTTYEDVPVDLVGLSHHRPWFEVDRTCEP